MRPRDTGIPHPADGCPKCDHGLGVVPYRTEQTDPEGVRCWYRCPRCRWSWWTSWGLAEGGEGWNYPHYRPDEHNLPECPCGCGIRYLRPAHETDYGTEAAS